MQFLNQLRLIGEIKGGGFKMKWLTFMTLIVFLATFVFNTVSVMAGTQGNLESQVNQTNIQGGDDDDDIGDLPIPPQIIDIINAVLELIS